MQINYKNKNILSKNNQRLTTMNEEDDDKTSSNKNINNLTLKVDAVKDATTTSNGSSNMTDFGKNDITPV